MGSVLLISLQPKAETETHPKEESSGGVVGLQQVGLCFQRRQGGKQR